MGKVFYAMCDLQRNLRGLFCVIGLALGFLSVSAQNESQEPCSGCRVLSIRYEEHAEYICLILPRSCSNPHCENSEFCQFPIAENIVRSVDNFAGRSYCACSIIPSPLRCGRSEIVGRYEAFEGVVVPPCTIAVVTIELLGVQQLITIEIKCDSENGESRRFLILNRETMCPLTHRTIYRFQTQSGCCPAWIPVFPAEKV